MIVFQKYINFSCLQAKNVFTENNPIAYFETKGYDVVVSYEEMLL